jgi:hypothetical protein
MRSARHKLLFLFLLVMGILAAPRAGAAEEGPSSSELEGIKARLAALDQQQKEILDKEDKILEELDRIRIWVHRK